MMDIVDRATRSRMMAAIRGRDTVPEWKLRRRLHAMGFRYQTASKGLRGRPDLVLRKWNAVIFVHGCFWHRHAKCRFTTTPRSNASFWNAKFRENLLRDAATASHLRRLGWRIAVVWECSLQTEAAAQRAAARVARWLASTKTTLNVGSGQRSSRRQFKLSYPTSRRSSKRTVASI